MCASLFSAVACTVRITLYRVRFLALLPAWKQGKLKDMKRRSFVNLRRVFAVWGLSLLIWAGRPGWGQATVSAVSAFDSYSKAVEARLAQQHGSQDHFLASG